MSLISKVATKLESIIHSGSSSSSGLSRSNTGLSGVLEKRLGILAIKSFRAGSGCGFSLYLESKLY